MYSDKKKQLDRFERGYRWRSFRLFVKVFYPVFILIALIMIFIKLDAQVLTGDEVRGVVVNVRVVQTGYRSISVMDAATVRLENGVVEHVSGVKYKVGDVVYFGVLKTKITGRLKYRHIVRLQPVQR